MKRKINIVIESGATKTDLVCIGDGKIQCSHTYSGFNPNYHAASKLAEMVKSIKSHHSDFLIEKVYFYGSGCSSFRSVKIVTDVFSESLPITPIYVYHDLFGAARALFGHGTGIAAILGTGSSSCFFKNGCIEFSMPSLGYLMADEGSGMHLGKLLLNAYFKGSLPEPIYSVFASELGMELPEFIARIYTHPSPNQYLASFVPFIHKHLDNDFLRNLVKKAFEEFIIEILSKYPSWNHYPVGFSGSVAFFFREILTELSVQYDFKIHKIIQRPIEELVNFHLNHPDE